MVYDHREDDEEYYSEYDKEYYGEECDCPLCVTGEAKEAIQRVQKIDPRKPAPKTVFFMTEDDGNLCFLGNDDPTQMEYPDFTRENARLIKRGNRIARYEFTGFVR